MNKQLNKTKLAKRNLKMEIILKIKNRDSIQLILMHIKTQKYQFKIVNRSINLHIKISQA